MTSLEGVDWLDVDVAVIGGGVVGVLAGIRLLDRGIDFAIFEGQADFGGVWTTHANNHSTLQVHHLTLDAEVLRSFHTAYIVCEHDV